MPNIYLTDPFVSNILCPVEKDQEIYWDHAVDEDGHIRSGSMSGLGLRVTALAAKSFVHAYQFNGKRYRKTLGSTVVLNVGAARLAVHNRQQQLKAGKNPDLAQTDPCNAHMLTVREAIDRYWESHVSGLSQTSQEAFARLAGRWLKQQPGIITRRGHNKKARYSDFGKMFADWPFASIKPSDIERFQRQFTSAHSYNSALTRISALFNWAIRMQLVDIRNPCDPIPKRKAIRRRRDYSTEQIRCIASHIFHPIFEAVPDTDTQTGLAKRNMALVKGRTQTANDQMLELCNYMGILFLTMARPSDLAKAEFDHFDLESLIWHKHNTKGIKLSRSLYEYAFRSVPIHSRVASMVRAQRQRWPEAKLLFPSHTDPEQPRDNFRKGLERFKTLRGVSLATVRPSRSR